MKSFREHITEAIDLELPDEFSTPDIYFKNHEYKLCVCFTKPAGILKATFSYYIGADWFPGLEGKVHLYVQSKLNTQFDENSGEECSKAETDLVQIDVIKMLFDALSEKETLNHTADLFEIKFDKPYINLNRSEDLLSPLLIIQYLRVVQHIVRKGLKKGYYQTTQNLNSRVKGKILISKTIKENIVKNKPLKTLCSFEEYGVDIPENRLLKKALIFAQSYLAKWPEMFKGKGIGEIFNFVHPEFANVSDEVSLHEIKRIKFNVFYKDYKHAIALAKLILKRFGYNIRTTQENLTIPTPPFWIDMSKLFELYVLKLLKSKYGKKIIYHPTTYGNELDFLLVDALDSIVIDAKYKPSYKNHTNHQDIRQVSGYARLKKVYHEIKLDENMDNPPVLKCLIIYPDQSLINDNSNLLLEELPIEAYVKVYKIGVRLPCINET